MLGRINLLLLVLATFPLATPAQDFGDSLKRTVQRAAESEVRSAADRETRRVTRCVLGDERCAREADARGEDIEYVDRSGRAVAAPAFKRVAEQLIQYLDLQPVAPAVGRHLFVAQGGDR